MCYNDFLIQSKARQLTLSMLLVELVVNELTYISP